MSPEESLQQFVYTRNECYFYTSLTLFSNSFPNFITNSENDGLRQGCASQHSSMMSYLQNN